MTPNRKSLFISFSLITIGVILFLILVGGIVRSSGAGMGCPDWPKCFGQWVPPTSVDQLPSNYQQIYHDRGYANTEFNVIKTWTEYINRLLGVFTGFFILLTVWFSYKEFKSGKRSVFFWSFLGLFLVLIQGWIGGMVVNSNLKPYLISIHMVLALGVVLALQIARRLSLVTQSNAELNVGALPFFLVMSMPILILVQIILGTQVRESVDMASQLNFGEAIFDHLGFGFSLHKLLSLLLLLGFSISFAHFEKIGEKQFRPLFLASGFVLVIQVVTGLLLQRFNLPAVPQTLHVFLSSLYFYLFSEISLKLYFLKQAQNRKFAL